MVTVSPDVAALAVVTTALFAWVIPPAKIPGENSAVLRVLVALGCPSTITCTVAVPAGSQLGWNLDAKLNGRSVEQWHGNPVDLHLRPG